MPPPGHSRYPLRAQMRLHPDGLSVRAVVLRTAPPESYRPTGFPGSNLAGSVAVEPRRFAAIAAFLADNPAWQGMLFPRGLQSRTCTEHAPLRLEIKPLARENKEKKGEYRKENRAKGRRKLIDTPHG